tara:strand:+ start:221 stop:421 length:201 start_codon:yes stop_codon:yes gene_type:complete
MKKTQNNLILAHLKKYKTINPLQALELYGSFRLSARILDLRQDGHNIETTRKTVKKKTFAEYNYAG